MSSFVSHLGPTQRGVAAALVNASVWTLYYYYFLTTPMPRGWTMRIAGPIGLGVAFVGGIVMRATSQRLWPIGVGVAFGLAFGAGEGYITDTMVPWWLRIWRGLEMCGLFSVYVWTCALAGWLAADVVLIRQRRRSEAAGSRRTRA